jgi:hypothetical protein
MSELISRLPRLRILELYDGWALAGVDTAIVANCPAFESLSIYEWYVFRSLSG